MLLTMLKIDLGITDTAYDDRFLAIIESAKHMMMEEGAGELNESDPEDAQLIIMYSAWLWNRRRTGEAMPRMLRWALNNRILSRKARE